MQKYTHGSTRHNIKNQKILQKQHRCKTDEAHCALNSHIKHDDQKENSEISDKIATPLNFANQQFYQHCLAVEAAQSTIEENPLKSNPTYTRSNLYDDHSHGLEESYKS